MKKNTALGGLLTAMLGAGTIPVQAGGLATGPIGRLSGELTVVGEDGIRQAVVTATTNYSPGTRMGTAVIHIKQGDTRLARATGTFTAENPEAALAAVTALVMVITGPTPGGRSGVRFSDVQFTGDSRAFAQYAKGVKDWWDAKAGLAADNYQSPQPNLGALGKLQLNIWGMNAGGGPIHSLAILFFDPADPTHIVGGIVRRDNFKGEVSAGSLTENTLTPSPGDFSLAFDATDTSTNTTFHGYAQLAIDVLPDGTIDVRGVSQDWFGPVGDFTLEGTGNTKFVVPQP